MKNWKDYGRAIIMFDEALGKFKESNYDKELALDTYNKVLAVLNHEFLNDKPELQKSEFMDKLYVLSQKLMDYHNGIISKDVLLRFM